MHLGIVVVYLITEETAGLLDVHLAQIDRMTRAPYHIYAAANRLHPQYRSVIEQQPNITICEPPTTALRRGAEHSYYLEYLVQQAIEEGATHVATVHLDSFPVKEGWEEQLAQHLSSECVFATIEHINTACLFFHRDFYLQVGPTFRLADKGRNCSDYAEYIKRYQPYEHSGIGYGFTAYKNGLKWHYMRPTATDGGWATIYDDCFFHLQHATYSSLPTVSTEKMLNSSFYLKSVASVRSLWKSTIPHSTRMAIRSLVLDQLQEYVSNPLSRNCRKKLIDDPDGYVAELRRNAGIVDASGR